MVGLNNATVTCLVSFPHDLAPLSILNCSYEINLLDKSPATNTAYVVLQNHIYNSPHRGEPGTTTFLTSVPIDFNSASVNEIDENVTVNDNNLGFTTTTTATVNSLFFNYSLDHIIGPYNECGSFVVNNTSSFETNDTHTTGNDSAQVNVNVACVNNCTYTFGYWKTHTQYGPSQPRDNTWNLINPVGENSPFFLSGQSYYQVLWTAPKGNAYYQLAHQFIAALLNILKGASAPSSVTTAISQSQSLFNSYTPSQIGALKGSNPLRQQFLNLANILGNYNEGLIGPGHCEQ